MSKNKSDSAVALAAGGAAGAGLGALGAKTSIGQMIQDKLTKPVDPELLKRLKTAPKHPGLTTLGASFLPFGRSFQKGRMLREAGVDRGTIKSMLKGSWLPGRAVKQTLEAHGLKGGSRAGAKASSLLSALSVVDPTGIAGLTGVGDMPAARRLSASTPGHPGRVASMLPSLGIGQHYTVNKARKALAAHTLGRAKSAATGAAKGKTKALLMALGALGGLGAAKTMGD